MPQTVLLLSFDDELFLSGAQRAAVKIVYWLVIGLTAALRLALGIVTEGLQFYRCSRTGVALFTRAAKDSTYRFGRSIVASFVVVTKTTADLLCCIANTV